MAKYQKYLFDDFVVGQEQPQEPDNKEDVAADVVAEDAQEAVQEVVEEPQEVPEETLDEDTSEDIEPVSPPAPSYSQEDLDEAIEKAVEETVVKVKQEVQSDEINRQNELLAEIKNQLAQIFTKSDEQTIGMEEDGLKFFVACLRKVLPTIDTVTALPEIKNFLQENFVNLRNQKSLAFYLAPDMAKEVAPLIEKAAEQNDFEGKISIHKDDKLGLSDCRIEWKDGYVERDVTQLLDKIEELLANNK